MTLFSMLAKLTLDSSQFNSALEEAQSDAESFEMPDDQSLELDNSEFNDALDESEAQGEEFSSSIGGVFKELKSVLVATGVVAVITSVVGALKEGVDIARKHGDTIDKQSQKLHLSAQAYQELDYALQLSGASVEDLTRAMRTFDEIQGGKITDDQAAYFKKLGISATDAGGKIKSAQQLMEETMYALADYTGNDRGLMMEAFFGRNSAGLNAFLNQTSDQIKGMRKEASDLGLIMTDEEVKNAAAYNDAVTRLEGSLQGIKEAFAGSIIPLLTDAANTIAGIIAFFNPRTKGQSLAEMFTGKEEKYTETIKDIEGTAAAAETLADKLLAMGDTSKMTAEQYAVWKGTAEALIGLVPTLGDVIDTETGQINGNTESISANIKEWERLAKQKAIQTLREEKYAAIAEREKDLIDKSIEANRKAAEAEKARTEAYHNFSDEMKRRGLGELDFEAGNLDEQISAVMQSLADMGDAGETDAAALGISLKNIGDAALEAGKAAAEVKKISEEIETAKQEVAEWEAAANELFGDTSTDASEATSEVAELNKELGKLPAHKQVLIDLITQGGTGVPMPEAKGLWSVPYDNFPALLHRGEQVLTASQARQGTGGVDYGYIGQMIGESINSALRDVGLYMYGDEVGRMTSKQVGKNIRAQDYAKQRAKGG